MSNKNKHINEYENNDYQKLLPLNSPFNPSDQMNKKNLSILSEEISLTHIDSKMLENDEVRNHSTIPTENFTKSNRSISTRSSSLSDLNSTETTKSILIQRILDSFKPLNNFKSSSDDTTNSSLSSLDEPIIPCQITTPSNKITINFQNKNELGIKPQAIDLLEKIESNNQCSCHPIEIIFNDHILDYQLSHKEKQSILRIILRRQQLFERYFT